MVFHHVIRVDCVVCVSSFMDLAAVESEKGVDLKKQAIEISNRDVRQGKQVTDKHFIGKKVEEWSSAELIKTF